MRFFKKNYKKLLPITLAFILISSICLVGSLAPSASGTGAGLAEWALNAYKDHWKYVYGGSTPGEVDCSGLIYSYCGGERSGTSQLNAATESGNVSDGIPNIHGLGLYQPGHVGVYVGNGMAVDARDEKSNVCYQSTATKSWTKWFKISAISYPTTGWEKYNDNYYYYENGEYVSDKSLEIGGVTYKFDEAGISDKTPDDINAKADKSVTETEPEKSDKVVMKLGSKGDDVSKLQKQLEKLGFYSGSQTGYFGNLTEEAYKEFQKTAGFIIDGVVCESDLEVLYSDDAPSIKSAGEISQKGDAGSDVKEIQNQLSKLKYYKGAKTGFYGTMTVKAVKQFQKDNKIDTSGVVGKVTKDKLFSKKALTKTEVKKNKLLKATKKALKKAAEKTVVTTKTSVKAVNKDAKSGVKAAQNVAVKTNKISRKALAGSATVKKVASLSTTEENNTNFFMWMLVVLGIAALVSGFMFTVNTRRKTSYTAARVYKKTDNSENLRRRNVTVRYW